MNLFYLLMTMALLPLWRIGRMSNIQTELTFEIRSKGGFGDEFKILIYADVDRDGHPDNIEMFWQNFVTKQQKELPKYVRAFVEKEYEYEIDGALQLASAEVDDTAYDQWKESFL